MTKIYIESHGCSTNMAEGEVIAGILEKAGYEIVDTPEEAFLIIVNICTVKGDIAAVRHVRSLKTKLPNKKYIVAGCVTHAVMQEVRKFEPDACFISTHNIKNIVEIVEESLNDFSVELVAFSKENKSNLPRVRKNKAVAIIPILSGCNGSCVYCSVKSIKGEIYSYPMDDIITEARKAVMSGCKELWLTSQDNACYMLDQNENNKEGKSKLPELLKNIIAIPGDFRIRLGMMNPNNVKPIVKELVELYKSSKMFKFLHLPLQSGADQVLSVMGRKYTADEFRKVVDEFRAHIANLTLATDVIIGFPGESRIFFSTTLEFIRHLSPDIVNISRFRARPGTPAADMPDQVPGFESKHRCELIMSIFENISSICNERWYKWQGTIVIDERGEGREWGGRNFAYKPVIVEGDFELGQEVEVVINKYTTFDLRGTVVRH